MQLASAIVIAKNERVDNRAIRWEISVLLVVATLAAILPARRAARVDPFEALRTDRRRLSSAYVKFRISDPLPVPGGRSRKHVHLTESGRRALAHSTAMFKRMLPGLSTVTGEPS